LNIEELQKNIGTNIRHARQSKNWSQTQLALEMLKDRQSISRVEKGKTSITLRTLLEFADALDIDYKELLA